jgi:drug/metabolite transporter (DMT)-like permease
MLWLMLALGAALFSSFRAVFVKHNVKSLDPLFVAWSWAFFGFIFLTPLLFFIEIPTMTKTFFIALIVTIILNTIAFNVYVKALKHGDLSVTVPMTAFTPLFLLITSPIIVGEFPSTQGLFGVLAIVIGSYVLHIKEKKDGILAPFKALIKQKGPRLMLLLAAIWSITANVDKIGIQNSSPFFWAICMSAGLSVSMFIVVLFKAREEIKKLPKHIKTVAPMGFFMALTLVTQFQALTFAIVPYVIAVKRLSGLLGVIWGKIIFKEDHFKDRILGAAIMVAGVILIALS